MRTALLLALLLGACTLAPPPPPEPQSAATGIEGSVSDNHGAPASGAYVYAYRSRRSQLRGPADFEAQVDGSGRYFLDVSEGDYYLVARLRQTGGDAGPPRSGDAWALPNRNPVTVAAGRSTVVDFVLQTLAQGMVMREGTLTSGATGVTGILLNDQGQPATGAFVLAYRDRNFQRMPDYTSFPVAGDGRFTLYLPEAGSYCFAARSRSRGQPQGGEPYGILEATPDGCLFVEEGKLREVGAIHLRPYRR